MKKLIRYSHIVLATLLFSTISQGKEAFEGGEVKIQWIGGPTMLIDFNGMKILTDPMLGEGEHAFEMADPNEMFDLSKGPNVKHHKRVTDMPELDLAQLDLVLLSHAHEDHFDQKAQAEIDNNLPMVLPIADLENIKGKGFKNLKPAKYGDVFSYQISKGTIEIIAVPADHTENKNIEHILGEGLGYVIRFKQGDKQTTIYWTGDSMPTDRVVEFVNGYGPINILVPNMGRVGTTGPLGQISMGASDVVELAAKLKVEKVFPIHHTSYELYLEPINVLSEAAIGKDWGLDIISEGSELVY